MLLCMAVELLQCSKPSSDSNCRLANLYDETTIGCVAKSNAPPVLKHLLVYGSVAAGQQQVTIPVITMVWFHPEMEL